MTTLVAVIGDDGDEAVAVACRRATNLARYYVPLPRLAAVDHADEVAEPDPPD